MWHKKMLTTKLTEALSASSALSQGKHDHSSCSDGGEPGEGGREGGGGVWGSPAVNGLARAIEDATQHVS